MPSRPSCRPTSTSHTDFNVVPGIRFEWYQVSRTNRVIAREESEAGGRMTAADCLDAVGTDECLSVDGILLNPDPSSESFDNFNALPGVSLRVHRPAHARRCSAAITAACPTGVLRNEDFPVEDEIGDNFNLGLRSHRHQGPRLRSRRLLPADRELPVRRLVLRRRRRPFVRPCRRSLRSTASNFSAA